MKPSALTKRLLGLALMLPVLAASPESAEAKETLDVSGHLKVFSSLSHPINDITSLGCCTSHVKGENLR